MYVWPSGLVFWVSRTWMSCEVGMTITLPTLVIYLAIIVPLGALYWYAVVKWWYPKTQQWLDDWLARKTAEIEAKYPEGDDE